MPSLPLRILLLALLVAACSRSSAPPADDGQEEWAAPPDVLAPALASEPEVARPSAPVERIGRPVAQEPAPLVRCVDGDGPLVRRSLEELEQLALRAEEEGDPARMLACAEEALRHAENHPAAAHLRAEALVDLGRLEEAQDAFVLALALAPDDPWVLAGAADLWGNLLEPRRDRSLAALAWAIRGLERAPDDAVDLRVRLHRLAGWTQLDLGNQREALVHAGVALHLLPGDRDALVIRGQALYELTRFPEAVRTLQKVLASHPDDAEAHHLLGLALERMEGREAEAAAHLAEASRLDPVAYPPPLDLEPAAFERLVEAELSALPEEAKRLLERGRVPVRIETLPALEDLRAESPPLSPSAVGMFRGRPLGLGDDEPREILLYRRNLLRVARDPEELRHQIRVTLLHELGHLAGEDEAELRARGLE